MTAAVLQPTFHDNEHFLSEPVSAPASLRADQGFVPQEQLGWLRESSAETPIHELRRRLELDGYVYVKHLLPREDVLKMREHYFSQFEGTRLLKPDAPFVEGRYNDEDDASLHKGLGGGGDPDGDELDRLTKSHTTPEYLSFVNHPRLRKMVRDLQGWDEEVMLTRTMLRHNVPGGASTGIHYDKLFLRDGDAYFLTGWVPIGDIKYDGGGLIYLEDSVPLGQGIEDDFNERAKDFSAEQKISAFNRNMMSTGFLSRDPNHFEEEFRRVANKVGTKSPTRHRWLMSNFEAGDVVFHHPCSIHASSGNDNPEGRIRLSTDLRFYDKKDYDKGEHDDRWMKFWTPGDGL